ncbi:type I-E CRISPR-associated endoribonuclease Cas2e [Solwaraspora sp. WMMD1047]|uniref:type I-E CRISPR-associated endoribonuclease Cas2e n=1 Tax=Solwaraspora sp. WMMD1047 TaxID=3016102 RepID=UPI00241775DB|nr:type I-E CRISPR-associated endoribonuclease Cas2e [Solwaraspora sp. WMMD1047]MDG4827693.1 type I-E CRISPR-associated endoribonuclease Cas2e [Solwaraspora sp. WMMD1047]MDG4834884.1 type I-E CRISPR-associated endoribonuclease Cas2e [Solwaraspora sp. WMMD1047]MDG4834885.1 type I-E CRISPR-associated endoribonuclease Cas2e [Solwaraspora sp. WMMD1047]
MASMVVLSTTAVPDHLRGALSRWMIEITPGMFVGTLSAKVRDELWATAAAVVGDGAAVLIHPDNTEQGYSIRTAGQRRRRPVDFDGLTLIAMNPMEPANTITEEIWPEGW